VQSLSSQINYDRKTFQIDKACLNTGDSVGFCLKLGKLVSKYAPNSFSRTSYDTAKSTKHLSINFLLLISNEQYL